MTVPVAIKVAGEKSAPAISGSGRPKREIELDFIRGIAILLVLVYHYRSRNELISSVFLNRVEDFGWTGVDLFFVLSGFLVGGLMLKEWKVTGNVNALRFLKRRGFKIWPSYYLFLLVATVLHVRPLRYFFWQNLFNIQNYVFTSLSHTWSLAVEEHFYLALAAGMAYVASRRWRPSTLLYMCSILILMVEALRAILILHHRSFYFYTHTRLDPLLMGVALAILRYFYPEWFARLQRRPILLCVFIAAALVALYINTNLNIPPQEMTSPYLVTLVDYACAALLLLLYRPGGKHHVAYKLIARMGVFSYGIYLWHVSVLRPADWAVRHTPHLLAPLASTVLPYVLGISLGIVATKMVEIPFLRLRERFVPATIPEPPVARG